MEVQENFLELLEIENIEYTDEYMNMVDITVEGDKSFSLSNGIISHNSALSMAIAGMSVVGRDFYGAFPLRGKVMNVRDASAQKIQANAEIQNLLNITGLVFGKKYTDVSELRYGKIIIFTDADIDGIHIKGLLMNFFEHNWPELLKMDFLFEFITPILKAKKGKESRSFYTLNEYQSWLAKSPKGWKVKYYKGLGTSTTKEAKEYFTELDKNLLPFTWDNDGNHDLIDMVFRTKRAEDRKKWMLNTIPKDVEKYETPTPISSFINNEMITFSLSDNIRSIPDIYDGLKPSQRKIIHTTLDKNINSDYPVASLGGLVKSSTKYHHGECLDYNTEINLADGSTIKIGDWYTHYRDLELVVKCVDGKGDETIGIGKHPIQGKITDEEYEIEMENGEIFKCTNNHMFLVGGDWIPAQSLNDEMEIIDIKMT